MAELTQDRTAFIERVGQIRGYQMAAGAVLYRHALVCINDQGYAVRAADALGLKSPAIGIAEQKADNSAVNAQDGDVIVRVRRREIVEVFTTADADAITQAHVGGQAYVIDDQTVARQASNNIVAGEVLGVAERGGQTIVTIQVGGA